MAERAKNTKKHCRSHFGKDLFSMIFRILFTQVSIMIETLEFVDSAQLYPTGSTPSLLTAIVL